LVSSLLEEKIEGWKCFENSFSEERKKDRRMKVFW